MTKPNYTHIVLLLDRSGSMVSCYEDMNGGLAKLLDDQKQEKNQATLSVYQFDDKFDTLVEFEDIHGLMADRYPKIEPRGMTSLLDAVGKTIVLTGEKLSSLTESERPERVMVVIITDGGENNSKEYNKQQISDMIRHQEDVYKWNFVYLGANQNAFSQAGSMGIYGSKTSNYNATSSGIDCMMKMSSDKLKYMRNCSSSIYEDVTMDGNHKLYSTYEQEELEKTV